MSIPRNNSFHLMLSDDELTLLRLLAEREGLTASDYLRTTLRRLAGTPPGVSEAFRARDLLEALLDKPKRAAAARKKPRA